MQSPSSQPIPTLQGGLTNTISVVGDAKVQIDPDTLTINISVSELAPTTKQAQDQTNQKMDQVQKILDTQKVEKKNIQTTNVNVYPEYNYLANGERKLLGYRSQQSLRIDIMDEKFVDNGSVIIDEIAKVGNVNIDSINFTLTNKEAAMQQVREKAFADAQTKAEQLAKLAGVSVKKPVSITDTNISYVPTPYPYPVMMKAEVAMDGAAAPSAQLQAGQLEVSMQLQVVYEIK